MPHLESIVPECRGLASDVVGLAERLDGFAASWSLSLIHGDCKGWNLFFNDKNRAIFIDMQWVGKGHPLQESLNMCTVSKNILVSNFNFVHNKIFQVKENS
jgi:Ser/Thr protein kinase RdoA (MazF antagonist)